MQTWIPSSLNLAKRLPSSLTLANRYTLHTKQPVDGDSLRLMQNSHFILNSLLTVFFISYCTLYKLVKGFLSLYTQTHTHTHCPFPFSHFTHNYTIFIYSLCFLNWLNFDLPIDRDKLQFRNISLLSSSRMGIPTPKKDTTNKTWSEDDLNR